MGKTCRPSNHVHNKGSIFLWSVEFTVQDLGRHRYTVLAVTSEEALELAFRYINSEYANPVVIRIYAYRETSLVIAAN